ncbi:hypothetical protein BJV78DRAFT_1312712 [Lactifluus subvellereus]|nr:hypothetical protein BJV78DRAFT_1312712 [Lactifluus subvellereus]
MASPSVNTGLLSDLIKAKVATLIQEQLQPVVHELAAQHQMLLSHTALLKHNHNVNDYQMTRLENLRNLEQSINFKMTGVLGDEAWDHPNIGTNLREPVPADPRLIPQFAPLENATPAERATESAALIAEAGMSARRLGGTPPYDVPSFPSYSGVAEPPEGGKGKRLYERQARKLKAKAMRRAAMAERGSSSSSRARAKHGGVVDDPAAAGPSNSTAAPVTRAHESANTAVLDMSIETSVPSSSGSAPAPTAPLSTRTESSTTTTIPTNSTATTIAGVTATKNKKKKSKDKGSSKGKSRSRADQQTEQQVVPTPVAPASPLTPRKRSHRALELEDDDVANDDRSVAVPKASKHVPQPQPKIKHEENGEEPQQEETQPETQPERAPKRRKRSAAPSPSPTIGLDNNSVGGGDDDGDGDDKSSQGPLRRSVRVTRASATGAGAAPVVVADTAAKGAAGRKRRSTSSKRSTRS